MVCLLQALEAIHEQWVIVDLLNRCVPLQIVLTASVIDSTWYRSLPIRISKVGLVLARAGTERISRLDLGYSIGRSTVPLL